MGKLSVSNISHLGGNCIAYLIGFCSGNHNGWKAVTVSREARDLKEKNKEMQSKNQWIIVTYY